MLIYNESNEDYHNNQAIGSGNIRDFLKSPRLFRDNMDGLFPRKATKALDLGILAHQYFLEPEAFEKQVALVPEGLDRRTKEGKAWSDANASKTLMSQEDWKTIEAMAARCPGYIFDRFAKGKNEVTCRLELEGLPVQCRFDCWHDTEHVIYDLKTTKDIDSISRSVWDYGYHIQSEWYCRLAKAETGHTHIMMFVFAETEPPYRWQEVLLSTALCDTAAKKVDEAISGINYRTKINDWSDLRAITTIDAPRWAKEN